MGTMKTLKTHYLIAPVTTILLTVTIVVFVIELVVSGGTTDNSYFLVQVGAKWGPYIKDDSQYWRLITPIFLHAGFMHIVTNMLTLWFIGPIAEDAFGSRKFLGLYFFSGISGNIFSYLFSPNTISVGASTSLFGLFGGLMIFAYQFRHDPNVRALGSMMGLFILLTLLSSFSATNIDLWGHFGGFIGGVMFAMIFGFYSRNGKFSWHVRLVMVLLTVLLIGLTVFMGVRS